MHEKYQLFDLSSHLLSISVVLLSIPIAILGILVVLWLVKFCKEQEYEKIKISKLMNKIYNSYLFTLSYGFILPYFFIRTTLLTHSNELQEEELILSTKILQILSNINFFMMAVIFAKQFRPYFVKSSNETRLKNAKRIYIPLYLSFSIVQLTVLWVWMNFAFEECIFVLFFTTIFYLLLILKIKPYQNLLENISLIFNSGLILAFLCYVYLRRIGVVGIDKQSDAIASLSFGGFFIVCVILSVIRVFRAVCITEKVAEERVE